jgi:hypothetical protein
MPSAPLSMGGATDDASVQLEHILDSDSNLVGSGGCKWVASVASETLRYSMALCITQQTLLSSSQLKFRAYL